MFCFLNAMLLRISPRSLGDSYKQVVVGAIRSTLETMWFAKYSIVFPVTAEFSNKWVLHLSNTNFRHAFFQKVKWIISFDSGNILIAYFSLMLDFLIYFLCHDFLLINFEITSALHTSYKNGPFKKLSFDNAKNCIDNNKPFENVVWVNVTRNRLHLYFVHAYINMFV